MSKKDKNTVYKKDPIQPWFKVLEEMGEFTKIGFRNSDSHNPNQSSEKQEPKWIYRDHQFFDGIGGFVDTLRELGTTYDSADIPTSNHDVESSWWTFIRAIPKLLFAKRNRLDFLPPILSSSQSPVKPLAITEGSLLAAWHAFSEDETSDIIKQSKALRVTVNTFLLHTLDQTIRESLQDKQSTTTWMLPINLRGSVSMPKETMNHSSCINIQLNSENTFNDTHKTIYATIAEKQHWQNWKGYVAGKWISKKQKKKLLIKDKAMPQWNLGLFSNLGAWDSDKKLNTLDTWYVLATVIECQRIGVGCITFQNKLSLTMQLHPLLTTDPEIANAWIADWAKRIKKRISISK